MIFLVTWPTVAKGLFGPYFSAFLKKKQGHSLKKKHRHAKFQWIPSNLKNRNEIGTYASLWRSPLITDLPRMEWVHCDPPSLHSTLQGIHQHNLERKRHCIISSLMSLAGFTHAYKVAPMQHVDPTQHEIQPQSYPERLDLPDRALICHKIPVSHKSQEFFLAHFLYPMLQICDQSRKPRQSLHQEVNFSWLVADAESAGNDSSSWSEKKKKHL